MNQIKIGKFIAERRKEKNLTQMQLAEKLSITDKAISKWERGITMPDSSLMLELCDILDITVNDLLNGEIINVDEQKKKTEELLIEMTRRENDLKKKLHTYSISICTIMFIISTILGVMNALVNLYADPQSAIIIINFSSVIWLAIISILAWISLKMQVDSGKFECTHCHHKFTPTYKQVFWSFTKGTPKKLKIHLKCPKCGKSSWAKKVLPE